MSSKEPTGKLKKSLEVLSIDQNDIDYFDKVMSDKASLLIFIDNFKEAFPRIYEDFVRKNLKVYLYVSDIERIMVSVKLSIVFNLLFFAIAPFYHAAFYKWPFSEESIIQNMEEHKDMDIIELKVAVIKEIISKIGQENAAGMLNSLATLRTNDLNKEALRIILAFYREANAEFNI
jgi:hypothetical protein